MTWSVSQCTALNTLLRSVADEPSLQGTYWRELPEDEQYEQLARSIGTLAKASNHRLGAGYSQRDADRLARRIRALLRYSGMGPGADAPADVEALQEAGRGLATVLEELRTEENAEVIDRVLLEWASVNININRRGQHG